MGTIRSAGTFLQKSGGAAAALLLLWTHAVGAASLVKVIDVRARTNVSNSSITVSVPSSGVAAGNSVILTLQAGDLEGAISCSDTVNGVYDVNVDSTTGTPRVAILSKHNVLAMGFGTDITCTYPEFSGASSLGAYEFSGLEPAGTLDQTSAGGSSVAGPASSGLTAATAQGNELVFGFVWLSPGQTFAAATSGGSPLESPYAPPYASITGAGTQRPMYRFVASIRQYEANGTIGGAGDWKAFVATYRLAPDLCGGVNCSDGNDCTVDSCIPATGACVHPPEAIGIRCGDRTSGICDSADRCDGAGVCLANHAPEGTECGQVDSDCELPDTCQQGICVDNTFKPAGSACGDPAVGACDAADSCNSSGYCLTNVAADGTNCGDAGRECVNGDSCQSGLCQDNGYAAAGSACGNGTSGPCDAADGCDGSGTCQTNQAATGSACNDGEECTIDEACTSSGQCVGVENPVCQVCNANVPPVVAGAVLPDPAGPRPVDNGGAVITAFFDDATNQTHACVIDWGDGSLPDHFAATEPTSSSPGSCTGNHLYTAVGVYEVAITVGDECGESAGTIYRYFVFYDPSAGFVTGGGWINSPEGAYTANPALSGRANFGFVARYDKKGTPDGQTQFHLAVAGFHFDSTSYDWFVLSGAKARLRGLGTVNGAPGYGFELTAWDGQLPGGGGADRFRIKIWLGTPGNVVYDNLLGQPEGADPAPLGGGSIVIHKK